jgi:hypothetical protein
LPADGSCVLEYRRRADGNWEAPALFAELRSAADRDLFVSVLDLTDRFRCHPVVPTTKLGAGRTFALADGAPIPASLPAGAAVVPGARVRDWLKLIVSDVDFDATTFTMQPLDEPRPLTRGRRAPRSTLDRLAARAVSRDIGAAPAETPVAEWTASTLLLEVRVPDGPDG